MIRKLDTKKAHQRYKLADGTVVPGGSTIAGIADYNSKGSLMAWANKEGLAGRGISHKSEATAGTTAHFLVECYLAGDTPDLSEISPELVGLAENAFIKWLDWWGKAGLTLVKSEVPLISEQYRFGGTADLICTDKEGKTVLADLKTGGIYTSAWIQVAGYGLCLPTPPDRYMIIMCGRTEDMSDFKVEERTDLEKHKAAFLAALNLYNVMKGLK